MSDDAADLQAVIEEQRAVDPRLEQAAPAADAPAEAPLPPAAEAAPEALAEAAPEAHPEPESPKKKRSAEDALKARISGLVKERSERDAELADARRRLEAAEALINARRTPAPPTPDARSAPAPAAVAPRSDLNPQTGRTYTEAEFAGAVKAQADADAFNRRAEALYEQGAQKFGDWKETVDTLNATGLMSKPLLDATFAVGDQTTGAALIHHLGSDVAEAERISRLSPIEMGVEMAKIAAQLAAPARAAPISGAPPPVPAVRGAVQAAVDLERAAGGGNEMAAYVAARAKQGSPWAQSRKRYGN